MGYVAVRSRSGKAPPCGPSLASKFPVRLAIVPPCAKIASLAVAVFAVLIYWCSSYWRKHDHLRINDVLH